MIVNRSTRPGLFYERGSSHVKKKLISWIASAALIVAPLSTAAADTSGATSSTKQPSTTQATGPLSPGKAAGIQQAQGVDGGDLLIITAIAVALGVGIWALTKDNGHNHHTTTTGTH